MKKQKQRNIAEKRAIVIEDSQKYRDELKEYGLGKFDTPSTLLEAEDLLRSRPYAVILMDGGLCNYEAYVEGYPDKEIDGLKVAQKIQEGFYGPLNQKAKIFSYSDSDWMKKHFPPVPYIKGYLSHLVSKLEFDKSDKYTIRKIEEQKKLLEKFIQEA